LLLLLLLLLFVSAFGCYRRCYGMVCSSIIFLSSTNSLFVVTRRSSKCRRRFVGVVVGVVDGCLVIFNLRAFCP
jgi:hypothetical protein